MNKKKKIIISVIIILIVTGIVIIALAVNVKNGGKAQSENGTIDSTNISMEVSETSIEKETEPDGKENTKASAHNTNQESLKAVESNQENVIDVQKAFEEDTEKKDAADSKDSNEDSTDNVKNNGKSEKSTDSQEETSEELWGGFY